MSLLILTQFVRNADSYQSVRKWTTKFDLFKKKYIIVPINEQYVWIRPRSFLIDHLSASIGIF